MAQLVLLVVAGIAGLVGHSEAAKTEKRFRRGPLGIPAIGWGVAGFAGAGLVGVLLGAEIVVAALIGFVSYSEAAKYERQSGAAPGGIPSPAWGVGCAALGLIGALVESTFVIWLVAGFVGYREAVRYETQFGKPALRVSPLVWGVAGFFFGLVGGLIVSALTWTVVCAFLGLVSAHLLLLAERNALLVERNARLAEGKTGRQPPPSVAHSEPAADAVVTPPAARRWAAAVTSRRSEPRRSEPRRSEPQGVAPRGVAPSSGGTDGGDLLPRRR